MERRIAAFDIIPGDPEIHVRELPNGEIPPGFNGFFELPIEIPLVANTFMHCPAGIAVTEKHLWVAHLSFLMPDRDHNELWRHWASFEKKPPQHLVAFGLDTGRMLSLNEAMIERTRGEKVDMNASIAEELEMYSLRLLQEGDVLTVRFEQTALPSHNLTKKLSLSRQ